MDKRFIKIPAVSEGYHHIIDISEIISVVDNTGGSAVKTKFKETIYYSTLNAEGIYDLICREQSLGKEKLTGEEQIIADAIVVAREVQEFLWGDKSMTLSHSWDRDAWLSIFYKRVDKIAEINIGGGSSMIELKKRVLQQAALSIAALKVINKINHKDGQK